MKLSVKHILAIALLVLLIIYGATKGLVYYKFKNAVDTASAQMRIFATLRYDSISSSLLDSSVSVHDISILPSGFEDGVKIDSITLTTPDIGYLLKGINSKRGEFPERLKLSMKGLKIDLYGAMTDKLEQMLSQMSSVLQGAVPATCGNKLFLGPAEYRDMGYDILTSDLEFGYEFGSEGIKMTLESTTEEMGSAIVLMKMTGPTRPSAMAVMSNPPQLTELSIAYQDLSYTKRTNEYCAKQSNKDITQYIEAEVAKSDKAYALQWGFIPGPGLKQAYKDFLTNPGTVTITMQPPEGFNQNTLGLYKAEDIPAMLNLQVTVNEQPVTDLSFTSAISELEKTDEKKVATLQERISTFKEILQKKDEEIPLVQQPTKIKKGPPPRYHRVALANLKSHLDRKVRVHTRLNQIRYGRLAKITGSALHVTQDVHRGEFTMIIPKGDVLKVEVFYAK